MFSELLTQGTVSSSSIGMSIGLNLGTTVLTSLVGPHEGAYTGSCEYKLWIHEPRE